MSNSEKQDNKDNKGDTLFQSLRKKIDNLFSDFLPDQDISPSNKSGTAKNFQPQVNISEDDEAYYLDAKLSGVKKENIKLDYHDDKTLTISFCLPDSVDKKSITAEIKDGVLKVVLKKAAKSESNSESSTDSIKIK